VLYREIRRNQTSTALAAGGIYQKLPRPIKKLT